MVAPGVKTGILLAHKKLVGTLVIQRLLKTNDTEWDIEINDVNVYVRWSTSENDTVGDQAVWMSRQVNLFTVDDPPLPTSPGPATTSRATTPIGPTTTTGPVTRHLRLDDNYTVEIEIGRSGFDAYITLLLNVNTTGYVGFGLNSNASRRGADLFIGGVNTVNNTLYGKDYHGTGRRMPIEDLNGQDWDVMVGSESEGMTSLLIGRLLDTKSPEEDYTISDSDVYVLWSYGENDTINHHVARGSRRLNLFNADDAVTTTTTTRKPGSGSGSSTLKTSFLLLVIVFFAFWK